MAVLAAGSLTPDGPVARSMADLWWLMLGVGTAVFVLVAGLLAYGLRRRSEPQAGDPDGGGGTTGLRWVVAGGVALPVVVLVVVFGATLRAMQDVPSQAPEGALTIEVIGWRWWWEVRYPESGVVTANELHLPVGRDIAFELTSGDVIHSFWVPALGGKMDALPDGVNTLVLRADEPGTHTSRCAEFCGLQHALMDVIVVAEPEEDFEAWLDRRGAPAATPASHDARRGAEVFADAGCAGCHAVAGTDADGDEGPDLTHIASRPTLGAGAVDNTPDRLADWVADPHDEKEGVLMPAPDLDDDDLDALLAYLGALR